MIWVVSTHTCAYFGCNATTFYTNAAAQQAYKDYIGFVVNRYKNSSAIFAWELCNEPRCHGCPSSTIHDWAADTSAYIKSLDDTHMVTIGDEGWMCSGGDGSYGESSHSNGIKRPILTIPVSILMRRRRRLCTKPANPNSRLRHPPSLPRPMGI